MIKYILAIFCVVLILTLVVGGAWRGRDFVFSKATGLPIAENDIKIDRSVRMRTPDGVILAADLYRPK